MGEIGNATDSLIEHLDKSVERPAVQIRLKTSERLPMEAFPTPAYSLIDMRQYFVASIQSSSGCPHQCEFCDVPGLYGRRPRSKQPEQITAELDKILENWSRGPVYFIDDDFIEDPGLESNVIYRLPRETIAAGWRRCLQEVYSPHNLLQRFLYQTRYTYPNRLAKRQVRPGDITLGVHLFTKVLWNIGCRSHYRKEF